MSSETIEEKNNQLANSVERLQLKKRTFLERIRRWKKGENQWGHRVSDGRSWAYVAWRFTVKYIFGKIGAFVFGLGCAVTTGYLSYALLLGGLGIPGIVLASAIFCATFYVNFRNNWRVTPKVLKQILVSGVKDWNHSLWPAFTIALVLCVLSAIGVAALSGGVVPGLALLIGLSAKYVLPLVILIGGGSFFSQFGMMFVASLDSLVANNGMIGACKRTWRFMRNTVAPLFSAIGNLFLAPVNLYRRYTHRKEIELFSLSSVFDGEDNKITTYPSFYLSEKQLNQAIKDLESELGVDSVEVAKDEDGREKRCDAQDAEGKLIYDCHGQKMIQVTFKVKRLEDPRHLYRDKDGTIKQKANMKLALESLLSTLVLPVSAFGVIGIALANYPSLIKVVPQVIGWVIVGAFALAGMPFYLKKAVLTINEVVKDIKDQWQAAKTVKEKFIVPFRLVLRVFNAFGNGVIAFFGMENAPGMTSPTLMYGSLGAGAANSYYFGAMPPPTKIYVESVDENSEQKDETPKENVTPRLSSNSNSFFKDSSAVIPGVSEANKPGISGSLT